MHFKGEKNYDGCYFIPYIHYDFDSDSQRKTSPPPSFNILIITTLSLSSTSALFLLGHAFNFTLDVVKYRYLFIRSLEEFNYGKLTACYLEKEM